MRNIPPGKKLNRPSALGAELGAYMARLCDDAESKKMLTRTRCQTCAFRLGTFPNACEATLMDALKCAAEHVDFICHEHKNERVLCAGYLATKFREPITVDWQWSNSDARTTAPIAPCVGGNGRLSGRNGRAWDLRDSRII